jgi:hypothetical protein
MKTTSNTSSLAITALCSSMIFTSLLVLPANSAEGGGTPGDGKEISPPQDGGPVQSNPAQDGVKPQEDPIHGDVPTKPDVDPDDKPPPAPPSTPGDRLPPKEPGVPSIPQ